MQQVTLCINLKGREKLEKPVCILKGVFKTK